MKSQLLILLNLFGFLFQAHAQSDTQWFISNGKGKNGLNAASNFNNYDNTIGNNTLFNLEGVSLPNLTNSPHARNDVFVIYANGDHFNSRYLNPDTPGFFYNAVDAQNLVLTHNFEVPSGMQISYLYLTNKYEGDDLPGKVKVSAGFAAGITNKYPVDKTIPNILSSDHDIVPNRDITIIVNYDLLDFDPTIVNTYVLSFNEIQPIGPGATISDSDILRPEPVFTNAGGSLAAAFPSTTYRVLTSNPPGSVTLSPVAREHYGYINFKPTQTAYQRYGPDANGNPTHSAIFKITRNGQKISTIQESLRASHDPNFLRVDSICEANDGSHTVFYHLEFENVSETAANGLKAQVTFPEMFEVSCLTPTKWYAGGATCNGRVSNVDSKYTFEFTGNQSISRCPDEFADVCKGFVEFRIKVKPGNALININVSLKLLDPKVYFDDKPFPIERFFDWIDYKGLEWRRPITIGNCDYCQPRLCVPCIGGAMAAAIIAVLLFVQRRRRKRIV